MAEAWSVVIQFLQQLKVLFLCNIFVHTSSDQQRRVSCLNPSIGIVDKWYFKHGYLQSVISVRMRILGEHEKKDSHSVSK